MLVRHQTLSVKVTSGGKETFQCVAFIFLGMFLPMGVGLCSLADFVRAR